MSMGAPCEALYIRLLRMEMKMPSAAAERRVVASRRLRRNAQRRLESSGAAIFEGVNNRRLRRGVQYSKDEKRKMREFQVSHVC